MTTKTIAPQGVYNGFARRRNAIALGTLFLTAVYWAACYALKESGSYLRPAEEFCVNSENELCSRPDLFAFQIGSGVAIFYCGVMGISTWHRSVHRDLPSTPEGRLFGYLAESELLAAANFTFQVWDFFVSLMIPEHATAVFLLHHVAAALVSWFSLSYQVLHYYGVFFLGCSEVSSIFLLFIDLGRYFPPTTGSPFDLLISICQPAFLITFGWYRIVLWWKVSILLWKDVIYVLKTGKAEELRPGKSFCLYIYLFLNVVLGLLQIFWFGIILRAAYEVVRG
eukprot:CAMPEP_0113550630 /NCGR_PEP_ID=MMETSP0015_2-20120614/14088_1 /TAXON_ID=2838 /ORGANISM="Odontella" /LENGTH=281 /DNA_ID=CAMNT_0000451457 /DNA_START=115 /DNA_END=960 /DNA_ORIENTATION=- /assembly_acc=CAM_ASM_000160